MIADRLTGLGQFEADLWKIADNLRANSNLASNESWIKSTPSCPFLPSRVKKERAVAADVYAHVWQRAVRGEFARAA